MLIEADATSPAMAEGKRWEGSVDLSIGGTTYRLVNEQAL
jgi:hypothetical protein